MRVLKSGAGSTGWIFNVLDVEAPAEYIDTGGGGDGQGGFGGNGGSGGGCGA
jgi:hypothetical protein